MCTASRHSSCQILDQDRSPVEFHFLLLPVPKQSQKLVVEVVSSYLKIGWRWLRQSWVQGWQLPVRLYLSNAADDPAIASRSQAVQRNQAFQFYIPGTTIPLSRRSKHPTSA